MVALALGSDTELGGRDRSFLVLGAIAGLVEEYQEGRAVVSATTTSVAPATSSEQANGTGAAPSGAATDCEVKLTLPGNGRQDATVRTSEPAIGSIVGMLVLLRRARSARSISCRVAAAALVVLTPIALAGLLSPLVSGLTGSGLLAAVALTSVGMVRG